jgi:2'-5' RNA ligase
LKYFAIGKKRIFWDRGAGTGDWVYPLYLEPRTLYLINMQRLFISVNCDDKVKDQLLSVQEMIKAQSVKGNFSRPENLHLTLVFIGETPEDKIQLVASVIEKALTLPVNPFGLTFSTTGCFTHSNKELWWIGTDSNDTRLAILKTIRQKIADGLLSEGINFDNRPFNPHITLGREIKGFALRCPHSLGHVRASTDATSLCSSIKHDSPIIIPKQEIIYPVNRISLMKSERVRGILTYTEIFGVDLIRSGVCH